MYDPREDIRRDLVTALVTFDWWDYGMDEVSAATSQEWAQDLADALIAQFPQLLPKDLVDGH